MVWRDYPSALVAACTLLLLCGLMGIIAPGSKPAATHFEVVKLPDLSFQLLKNGEPFVVKGVCYSPMEISSHVDDAEISGEDKRVVGTMFGDTFWDAVTFLGAVEQNSLRNWFGLWGSGSLTSEHDGRGDLKQIAETLHANAIRVYFMQSRRYEEAATLQAKPPDECERRYHTAFLDEAYKNGLYVLVGLALPINLFHLDIHNRSDITQPGLVEWWEFVLAETVAEVGSHPATLGFTIMNELDDEPNAFPGLGMNPHPDENSDFFHSQVVKYAKIVRNAAPGKLVGWALHDVPSWPGFAISARPTRDTEHLTRHETYFQQISNVFDYYGVNTYQSESLAAVLGHLGDNAELGGGGKAYAAPSLGPYAKPVLLTEIGWPATGRADVGDSVSTMTDNKETQVPVANTIRSMLPQVYELYRNISIGAFYFEYTDEWWKTPAQLAANGDLAGPWHHDAGDNCQNLGFPNFCNDEESFGLYSRARSGGRGLNSSNWVETEIVLPVDTLIPRTPMVQALADVYGSVVLPNITQGAAERSEYLKLSSVHTFRDSRLNSFMVKWWIPEVLRCATQFVSMTVVAVFILHRVFGARDSLVATLGEPLLRSESHPLLWQP